MAGKLASPRNLEHRITACYDIINSLQFEECNKALIRIVNRIDFKRIKDTIENIENISALRGRFYEIMLEERYEKILLDSYKILQKNKTIRKEMNGEHYIELHSLLINYFNKFLSISFV